MRLIYTIAQMLVRVTGMLQLILGLLIWTENMTNLTSIHMLIGIVFVASLVVFAAAAHYQGASLGAAIGLVMLAIVVLGLGMTQMNLLPRPDPNHWLIEVVHLLIGLAAIGIAEALGGRSRRRRVAQVNP